MGRSEFCFPVLLQLKLDDFLPLARLPDRHLVDVRIALACVAEGVVVNRAQHPILLVNIPLGPGIARDEFGPAFLADHADLWCFLLRDHSSMMTGYMREGRVGGQGLVQCG